jgi:glycosyltransferase involved in cell wall biosynthesis
VTPVPTFSVIVPTKGRPSIHRTLESIVPQLEHGDEVIVVRDSTGDSGDTARNDGMSRARGTHLLFMDDDDVYVPGAFAAMRRFAAENPGRIGIFKVEYVVGNRRWVDPELRFKNVSTQMYVVPNAPGKLGRWERHGRIPGDYVFIEETVRLQGEPVFVDEVTVLMRPERNPLKRAIARARYRAKLGARLRSLTGKAQTK